MGDQQVLRRPCSNWWGMQPARQYGREATHTVETTFTKEQYIAKWQELYGRTKTVKLLPKICPERRSQSSANEAEVTTLGVFRRPSQRARAQGAYPPGVLQLLAVFVVGTLALTVIGGTIARLAIPLLCTGTAYVLYRRAPVVYVSFVWWLWFLICWLRRVVDYRSGFAESNPVLAAIPGCTLCAPALLSIAKHGAPFELALSSGVLQRDIRIGGGTSHDSQKATATSALGWLAPLVFGSSCRRSWRASGAKPRSRVCRDIPGGTLVMGCYGIIHFVSPPPWDIPWMLATQTAWPGLGSIGTPEALVCASPHHEWTRSICLTVVPGLLVAVTRKGFYRSLPALPDAVPCCCPPCGRPGLPCASRFCCWQS